jgi:hypothetical protein
MEKRATKISRSWGATIGYLIGGFVAIGVSIILFMTIVEGPVTVGIALLPGIIGIALLYMSFGGSGTSSCPLCASPIAGLSTKANDGVLCVACHNYVEGQGGLLWQTDAERIAEEPLFSSPLPERFNFPPGCCVCGAPEAEREQVKFRTQNASSALTAATVGVTTSTEISVAVPHCAAHKGGARLSATAQHTQIKFRSYPYLRAFCQLNDTVPG